MKAKVRFSARSIGDRDWRAVLNVRNQDDLMSVAQEIADHENADFTIESLEA